MLLDPPVQYFRLWTEDVSSVWRAIFNLQWDKHKLGHHFWIFLMNWVESDRWVHRYTPMLKVTGQFFSSILDQHQWWLYWKTKTNQESKSLTTLHKAANREIAWACRYKGQSAIHPGEWEKRKIQQQQSETEQYRHKAFYSSESPSYKRVVASLPLNWEKSRNQPRCQKNKIKVRASAPIPPKTNG